MGIGWLAEGWAVRPAPSNLVSEIRLAPPSTTPNTESLASPESPSTSIGYPRERLTAELEARPALGSSTGTGGRQRLLYRVHALRIFVAFSVGCLQSSSSFPAIQKQFECTDSMRRLRFAGSANCRHILVTSPSSSAAPPSVGVSIDSRSAMHRWRYTICAPSCVCVTRSSRRRMTPASRSS